MDVLTILSTLRRHWKVVASVLALTAVALAIVFVTDEPTYQMRGSYLVSTPDLAAAEEPADDAASPSAVTDLSGPLVAEAVQSGDVHEQVVSEGGRADYTVAADENLLRVMATSSDREAVVPTVTAVLDAIEREVAIIQEDAGVPEDRRATVQVISTPSDASVRTRAVEDDGAGYSAQGSVRIGGLSASLGSNPYRESPEFAMRVLQEVLGGESTKTRIEEAGGTGRYGFEQQDGDAAPVTYLTATADTAEEAEATHDAALTVAREELSMRQEALGALGSSQVGLYPLSVPSAAEKMPADLTRALITIAGVGAAAAVGAALSWDNLQQALRRRRQVGDGDTLRKDSEDGAQPGSSDEPGVDHGSEWPGAHDTDDADVPTAATSSARGAAGRSSAVPHPDRV